VNLLGSYNYALVALSVLIAMFASYAALDLAGRVTAASGWTRTVWLLGGAGAMGTGIWSMHYIGMLAFILPIPVAYHWPTVLLSLFAAIAASVIALYVVSRQKMGTSSAVAASVLMGGGIASMHYIGMDAMRLPAICRSNSSLVVLSVVFAVLISFAALWITFHFRDEKTGIGRRKLAGAVVMGAAIPVMHYTGMAAASFTSSGMPEDLSHAVSVSTLGIAGIAAVTFIVLGLALLTSWMDRRFAAQALELDRKRWRSLTEALPQLVWAATPDGACDYFSTQWTEYTGVPEAGLLGWRWMEVLHPDDRENTRQVWGDSVAGRRPYDVEYRVRRHDGAYGWFKTRGTPIRDSAGRITKWFGTCTDITDWKRAEEALHHSEQALRRARDELEVKVAERTAELQRSKAYLAEAQTLSRTGSFGWRVSSGAIFWSEETFRIFQYDRTTQPTVERVLQRTHPQDAAFVKQTIERASQDGKDFEHEYRLVMPDGLVKHVHVVARALSDASGELEFVGSVMDITERKRSEAELLRQTALLDELFVGGPDAVALSSLAKRVVRVNREFAALFGYAEEEVVGVSLADLIVPEDELERSVAARARAQSTVERVAFEGMRRRKDGTLIQVSIKGGPIVLRGQPIGYYAMYRDITERKRNEAEVLHQTALLDELFEGSPDAVVLMDLEARVLRISREFAALFGYAAEEAAGRLIVDLIVPEDELENSRAGLARAQTGERFADERERRRKDGTRIHVSIKRALIVVGGKPIGYYGIYRDITERKRAEEAQRASAREREEMQRQLQQAAKLEAIGRLAGGIAHDFNNILGAILGYGEIAQKNLQGHDMRRHVDQVMLAGARGKGLVERILAFSRSGLGERVPVHVQSVVEETLEMLAASLAPNLRLERQLDAGDTAVVGDATQFHQVAMNLCTNALQAMEQGGVLTVVLERAAVPERRALSHGTLSPGPYVRLSVSDTGSGIPAAVLERMFDPFFTTKGVGDGTGLGLSLVHGIVADFGGAIDVTTQAGAGTTFTVWLPAAGETPRIVSEPAADLPQGNGETVMIVDDQLSLVTHAEETLAALGYDPAGFRSSVAALQAFRAEPQRYDLLLTDETMPDMSGVELAREMRRVRPDLPIVLMSGYSGAQLAERAQAVGVGEVLRKPLLRRDIAQAVARALRPS
jgi:PAS domain S-box-containing protein